MAKINYANDSSGAPPFQTTVAGADGTVFVNDRGTWVQLTSPARASGVNGPTKTSLSFADTRGLSRRAGNTLPSHGNTASSSTFAPQWKFNPPMIKNANGAPKGTPSTLPSYNIQTAPNAPTQSIVDKVNADYRNSGSYTGDNVGRPLVLLSGDQNARVFLKGTLKPDITFLKDWNLSTGGGSDVNNSGPSVFANDSSVYGFRFLYNPSTITFGFGSASTGINLSLFSQGGTTAMPSGLGVDGAGSISLNLILSRVEDFSAITVTKPNSSAAAGAGRVYSVDDYLETYGYNIGESELAGIKTRGTMYDIEYLLRAMMGKAWNSLYRGTTADMGILFSVPMVLTLGGLPAGTSAYNNPTGGGGMTYRVRVTDISFTHGYFTPDMIPLYTELSINMYRLPDGLPNPNDVSSTNPNSGTTTPSTPPVTTSASSSPYRSPPPGYGPSAVR